MLFLPEDDGFDSAIESSSLFIHATKPKGRQKTRERDRMMGYNGLHCESISQFGIYIPAGKTA
jgi:hypothetical protein